MCKILQGIAYLSQSVAESFLRLLNKRETEKLRKDQRHNLDGRGEA